MNIRIRLLCGLLAALSLSLPVAAKAQGLSGMTLSPLMFRYQVGGGQKVTLQLQIQNLQQDVLNVKVDVDSVLFDDWTYQPKFDISHPNDCSTWFKTPEINQQILSNNEGFVNLVLQVPHVKPGVYWCMARVQPHYQNDPSTINPEYQVPIILLLGAQARPQLKLGSPEMVQVNHAEEVHIPFENQGGGFTVIGANVELRQANTGRVIGTYYDADRNLYPGSKRNLVFYAGDLGEGQYILSSKPQAGTRSFSPMVRRFNVTKTGIVPADADETYELSPITFDPSTIHVEMPAGGERSAVIHVINNSQRHVSVSIQPRALTQGADGAFEVGDTPPIGPLVVAADPTAVELDPGRMAAVRISIAASKDAIGDLWFGLTAKSDQSNEISEQIYGRVALPGGAPKLELKQNEIKKMGQYPYTVTFQVTNTGTISLKPIPFAQVFEQGLNLIANLQVPSLGDGGILPGSVLRNSVMLPLNLKPGAYTVSIKYQYGQDLFANLSVPIMIPGTKANTKGAKEQHEENKKQ